MTILEFNPRNLRKMLKDDDGSVRREAVTALARVAGRDAISDLREMLKDGSIDTQRAAISGLAQTAG